MKILVISDSHGDIELIKKVINLHENEIDVIFHTGDFAKDISFYSKKQVYSVIGNTDGLKRDKTDLELVLKLKNKSILLTHSDHLKTHYTLTHLKYRAQELGVDLCVFGHTHKPFIDDKEYPILFNPGSLSRFNTLPPHYGIITLNKKIICKHYHL